MQIQRTSDLTIFLRFIVSNILKLILLLFFGLIFSYFSYNFFFKAKTVGINFKIESKEISAMEMQALNFIIREIHNFQYLNSYAPKDEENYEKPLKFNKKNYNKISYDILKEFVKLHKAGFAISKIKEDDNAFKVSYKSDVKFTRADIDKQVLEFESDLNNFFFSDIDNQMKRISSSFGQIKKYKIFLLEKEMEIYDSNYRNSLSELIERLESENKIAIDLYIQDVLNNLNENESVKSQVELQEEGPDDYSLDKDLFLYGFNMLKKKIDILEVRSSDSVGIIDSKNINIKLKKIDTLIYDEVLSDIFETYSSDGYFSKNYKASGISIVKSKSFLLYTVICSLIPILLYFFYSFLIFVYNNTNKEKL